jgi:hypothetical protein
VNGLVFSIGSKPCSIALLDGARLGTPADPSCEKAFTAFCRVTAELLTSAKDEIAKVKIGGYLALHTSTIPFVTA